MWEYNYYNPTELYHYGVPGMKWGRRKARTTIGNRYHTRAARNVQRDADNLRKHGYKTEADAVQKVADKHRQKAAESQRKANTQNLNKRREIAIATTAVVGTALAAYGAHKMSNVIKDRAFQKSMQKGSKAIESFIDNFDAKPYSVYERYKENIDFAYNDYGRSATKAIRTAISNNSVNKRVNWKGVYNTFR